VALLNCEVVMEFARRRGWRSSQILGARGSVDQGGLKAIGEDSFVTGSFLFGM